MSLKTIHKMSYKICLATEPGGGGCCIIHKPSRAQLGTMLHEDPGHANDKGSGLTLLHAAVL